MMEVHRAFHAVEKNQMRLGPRLKKPGEPNPKASWSADILSDEILDEQPSETALSFLSIYVEELV